VSNLAEMTGVPRSEGWDWGP